MGKRKITKKTLNPKSKIPKTNKLSEIKQESADEELGGGKVCGDGNGFFACYLLTSLNPRHKGHTYIGFTVNPRRRIRQHNGEIGSGAWRTKRKRPWEMVFCIYGFPTNVSALQFEWAWQHPVESLAVRKAAVAFKSLNGLANKIKLAHTMLTLPAWESMNLTVNYFSTKYKHHCAGCPDLPPNMKVVVRSMDELPCYTGGDENVLDNDSLEDEECSGMGGSEKLVLDGSELLDEMPVSYSTDDHNCIEKATPIQSRISDLFRQKKQRADSPSKEEGHREQPYIGFGSPERSFKKPNGGEYIGDFYLELPFCDLDFKEKGTSSIVTNPNDGVGIDREDEMPVSYSGDDHSCIYKDTPVQSRISGLIRPKKTRADSACKEGHREQPYIDIGSPEMSFKKPNGDAYTGDYHRDRPFCYFHFSERAMPSFFATPNEGVEIDREDYREPTLGFIGSPDKAIPLLGTNPNGDAEIDKKDSREPTTCIIGSPDKVIPSLGTKPNVTDKEDYKEPTICFIGSPDKAIQSFGTNLNGDVEVVGEVGGQAFCNIGTPETAIPSFVTEASDVEIVGVTREEGRIELNRPWQQNMSTIRVDKDAPLIKNRVVLSELEVIDVFTPSPEFQIASRRKKRGNSAVSPHVIDLTESPSSV